MQQRNKYYVFSYEDILEGEVRMESAEKQGDIYTLSNYGISQRSQDQFIDMLMKCNNGKRDWKRYKEDAQSLSDTVIEMTKIIKKFRLEDL